MTSCPVEVAWTSGSAARRPVMVMRATECAAEELKVRVAVFARRRVGRREVKADILNLGMIEGV